QFLPPDPRQPGRHQPGRHHSRTESLESRHEFAPQVQNQRTLEHHLQRAVLQRVQPRSVRRSFGQPAKSPSLRSDHRTVQQPACDPTGTARRLLSSTVKAAVALMFASLAAAQSWAPQNSGTTASLRGVSAVTAEVAWASGTGGTYLK